MNVSAEQFVIANIVTNEADQIMEKLGPGFTEHIYEKALMIRLRQNVQSKTNALKISEQVAIPIMFEEQQIGYGIADIFIEDQENKENSIIIELKSKNSSITANDIAQTTAYMRTKNVKIGLILCFANNGNVLKKLLIN